MLGMTKSPAALAAEKKNSSSTDNLDRLKQSRTNLDEGDKAYQGISSSDLEYWEAKNNELSKSQTGFNASPNSSSGKPVDDEKSKIID